MLIDKRPDYKGEAYGVVLLHDIHAEYTQCLSDLPLYGPPDFQTKKVNVATHVRCELIWDQYSHENTVELMGLVNKEDDSSDQVLRGFYAIFGNSLEILLDGMDPHNIWKISGGIAGLTRAFEALRSSLMPIYNDGGSITSPFWQPSGDDDVFDYWPNTMDMLYEFALNLDELTHQADYYQKRVWSIIDRMIEVGSWADYLPGGESAFEWDVTNRWGYGK